MTSIPIRDFRDGLEAQRRRLLDEIDAAVEHAFFQYTVALLRDLRECSTLEEMDACFKSNDLFSAADNLACLIEQILGRADATLLRELQNAGSNKADRTAERRSPL